MFNQTWENDSLCRSLSKAVAECCKLEGNSRAFGELKAVAPLCGFLTSKEPKVVREATKALSALSEDARNRITIHQCGVVPVSCLILKLGTKCSNNYIYIQKTMFISLYAVVVQQCKVQL